MMILKEGEICPFANNCPYNQNSYNGPCHGTLSTRENKFVCDYVVNGQIIQDGAPRIPGDKTGRMKVIID